MDKLANTINFFKTPNIYRDLLICIYGVIGLLTVTHFIFGGIPENYTKFSGIEFPDYFLFLLVLLAGFTYGKFAKIISNFFEHIIKIANYILVWIFFCSETYKSRVKFLRTKWKTGFKKDLENFFSSTYNRKGVHSDELETEITSLERAEIVKDYPLMIEELERAIGVKILIEITFPTLVLLGYQTNTLFYVPAVFCFFALMDYARHIGNERNNIFRATVKKVANSNKNQ